MTYTSRGRPTLPPKFDFNPSHDADAIRNAIKGIGTDKEALVGILSRRTFAQRTQIAQAYLNAFGKHLDKELKSELSGDFQELILSSLDGPALLLANFLRRAIKGVGTNTKVLIQILVAVSNEEIKAIRAAYENVLKQDLEKDIRGDTSGAFANLLVSLIQGNRDERDRYDKALMEEDVAALHEAVEKHFNVDEATIAKIMTQRHYLHIRQIAKTYMEKYSKTLIELVKSTFGGNFAETLVEIIAFSEDKAAVYARWIHDAMGDDHDLIRLILTRSEVDMEDIKDAYQRQYNKLLANAIEDKKSGAYKKMLIGLISIAN